MNGFRSYRRQGVIWLAAIALLAGAAPRIGCVCPDGQEKLFCCRVFAKVDVLTVGCPCGEGRVGGCSRCHHAPGKSLASGQSCRPLVSDAEFIGSPSEHVVAVSPLIQTVRTVDEPKNLPQVHATTLSAIASCLPPPDICTTFQVQLI